MDPQDDPEARIRELERPLSDVARTSELGTTPTGGDYPYPPPPPSPPPSPPPTAPWPYDAGQQPLPPSTGSGGRAARIIGGLAAVVGLAIAGGVAAFLVSGTGGIPGAPVNRPTINGGGGTVSTAPTSTVAIPSLGQSPSTEATESAPVSTVVPGGTVSVSGIGEHKTIACDGGVINVSGVSNTVVITGHCASLSVSGIENVITVDNADAIGVSGFDNRITYHSGTPNVSNSGGSNIVEQG